LGLRPQQNAHSGSGHNASALPTELPKRAPPFVPYIYSHDDLRRLLGAIPSYRRYRTRIELPTLRAILLLLYGAGLRAREALGLSAADVDLPNTLLTIRDAKFFKSRLVPIGRHLTGVLTDGAAANGRPTNAIRSGATAIASWTRAPCGGWSGLPRSSVLGKVRSSTTA
jgi:integrase